MRASERQVDCPICGGLGLRPHVSLFEFAGRGYQDWLAKGTVAQLHVALRALAAPSARAERRRARLLEVLAPFAQGKLGATKLRAPILDGPWPTFTPAVAAAFTDMPVILEQQS